MYIFGRTTEEELKKWHGGTHYKTAAEEFVQLILSVEPSDYVWEVVYEDIPVNMK